MNDAAWTPARGLRLGVGVECGVWEKRFFIINALTRSSLAGFLKTYLPHPTPYFLLFRISGRPRLMAEEGPEACPELDSGSMLSGKPKFRWSGQDS